MKGRSENSPTLHHWRWRTLEPADVARAPWLAVQKVSCSDGTKDAVFGGLWVHDALLFGPASEKIGEELTSTPWSW
jgi:hypothetical protein